MFLLMREFCSARAAFGLALVFYAGTTFMPYAKTAWDVTPAAASLCAWLYFMARALRPPTSLWVFVAAGVALGLACSFRYSLLPFFGMGVLWLLWMERARHKTGFAVLLVALGITMLPAFYYNHIRTGLFLRPAIAADLHISDSLALNGNPVTGLLGLLASPNMGLFLFAPVLLLALFVFKMRHTLPARQKHLLYAALASGVCYLLMIAHMKNWGHFGWGPRYMVPLLPVLFFAAAPALQWMWQHARRTAVPLLVISFLLNLAPTLINWHVIVGEFPGARPQNSALPYQHIGVWTGIQMSLAGEPLVFPKTNDPKTAMTDAARRFPTSSRCGWSSCPRPARRRARSGPCCSWAGCCCRCGISCPPRRRRGVPGVPSAGWQPPRRMCSHRHIRHPVARAPTGHSRPLRLAAEQRLAG